MDRIPLPNQSLAHPDINLGYGRVIASSWYADEDQIFLVLNQYAPYYKVVLRELHTEGYSPVPTWVYHTLGVFCNIGAATMAYAHFGGDTSDTEHLYTKGLLSNEGQAYTATYFDAPIMKDDEDL